MKIGNQVYETLTPEQRLVAMVEASNRDDENEMRRLGELQNELAEIEADHQAGLVSLRLALGG